MSQPAATSEQAGERTAAVRFRWLTGGLLLGAVVLAVTHVAEERELARRLRGMRPLWLVSALSLQAATYVLAAAVWQRALARQAPPHRLRLWTLVPLGLAKLFTDQAVPSAGVSGTLLVVRALERRGVPRGAAVACVLTGLVGFYVAYFLATAVAVAFLWRRGELHPAILAPTALLGLVLAGLPLGLLYLRGRALQGRPRWLVRLPGVRGLASVLAESSHGALVGVRVLAETTLLQLGIFVLDALTLLVTLRAVASAVDPAVVFASFVVASVVATLGGIPGGLGTFEASCVAMLHLHGVAVEAALAATLLLRGFSFWLPMLPGFALVRREAQPLPRATAP